MVIDYLYRKKEKEKLEGKMGEYLISTLENAFLSTKFWKNRYCCLTGLSANPRTIAGIEQLLNIHYKLTKAKKINKEFISNPKKIEDWYKSYCVSHLCEIYH